MARLIASRIWQGALMLLALSLLVFGLARMSGSPANLLLPPDATREDVAAFEKQMGLNEPLPVQFGVFIGSALRGDLGTSLRSRRPVTEMFFERLPATLQLALVGVFIMSIGLPLGVISAIWRGSLVDLAVRMVASLGQAIPHFWLGTMLALAFGVWWHLLPVAGRSGWESTLLPAIALSMYPLAGIARLVRSSMLQVMDQDFILVARAKGLSNLQVTLKHGLRNALIPVLAFASIMIVTHFLTGAVIIETVFAWPGVGYLGYQSVLQRDYPVLQGVVLLFGLLYVLVNLTVDIAYAYIDPRIRL